MRAFVAVAALVLCDSASASITVTHNAQRPTLKVDARGYAEVSWTEGGSRKTLLVPPTGRPVPGGRARPDVSRAASVRVPFATSVRRTPDGRMWALQAWRVRAQGPVELRFSRWSGAPTIVDLLESTPSASSELLTGVATFGELGFAGSPARVDCLGCGRSGWRRFASVGLRPDGSFRLLVPAPFKARKYRVSVVGPNRGRTLAPDASATVASSL